MSASLLTLNLLSDDFTSVDHTKEVQRLGESSREIEIGSL